MGRGEQREDARPTLASREQGGPAEARCYDGTRVRTRTIHACGWASRRWGVGGASSPRQRPGRGGARRPIRPGHAHARRRAGPCAGPTQHQETRGRGGGGPQPRTAPMAGTSTATPLGVAGPTLAPQRVRGLPTRCGGRVPIPSCRDGQHWRLLPPTRQRWQQQSMWPHGWWQDDQGKDRASFGWPCRRTHDQTRGSASRCRSSQGGRQHHSEPCARGMHRMPWLCGRWVHGRPCWRQTAYPPGLVGTEECRNMVGTRRCGMPKCGGGLPRGGRMGVGEALSVDGSRNAPEHSSEHRGGQAAQRGVRGARPWDRGAWREGGGEVEAGGGEGAAAGSVGECAEVRATGAGARNSRHACEAR